MMNELIELLDLRELLPPVFDETPSDFEVLYDVLPDRPEYESVVEGIESRVRDYFLDLCLPGTVTLYDRLVLSLRRKDLIATFNWDPLLVQAYRRNAHLQELPRLAFLHGNVAVSACSDHSTGYCGDRCTICGELLEPVQLLHPVRKKDYTDDPFIRSQWKCLEQYLQHAYRVTVFGYSAPRSDEAAIELMHKVWTVHRTNVLAQVDIIDIADESELYSRWRDFIVDNHYGISDSLDISPLSRFPRRTCEALGHATLLNLPFSGMTLPVTSDLEELQQAVLPLIDEEHEYRENGRPFRTSWD